MSEKEILSKAIVKYGIRQQSVIAIEEMAELTKEISKALRGVRNKENLAEEIADVLIMIEQVKMMFNISEDDITAYKNTKLYRLSGNLTKE